ncbi:MAG TPA: hypothetical protein VII05_06940 [Gaiellaceae bacterium]
MLVVADSPVAPFTIVFFVTFLGIAVARAALKAVRRGSRLLRGSLVVRDGHAALSDEARANLEKRGMNVEKMERLVEKTYRVNARGEIVMGEESSEEETPTRPTSRTAPVTGSGSDRPIYRKPSVEDLLGGRPRK